MHEGESFTAPAFMRNMSAQAIFNYMTQDTICAVSTSPGIGGIALIRVSGPDAFATVQRIWRGRPIESMAPRTAHLGDIIDSRGETLDQALLTPFKAPASFTGEDVVEISVHGSRWIQAELIRALLGAGCRLAEPGEYTRRAFASGRIGLTEAEGIADMIASSSRASHRLALTQMRGGLSRRLAELRDKLLELSSLLELELDFSEEDVEFASRDKLKDLAQETLDEVRRMASTFAAGNAIKEGIPVAIIGATNAGKSSLLNRLLGDDRAIVSDIHGTTRDIIEDTVNIGDFTFRMLDTAGLRKTDDKIEALGIKRSYDAISRASIVILVIDPTQPIPWDIPRGSSAMMQRGAHLIVAINKTDLTYDKRRISGLDGFAEIVSKSMGIPTDILPISAKSGDGIAALRQRLADIAAETESGADLLITNARHHQALNQAAIALSRVVAGLDTDLSGDFIAQDLRQALHHLGEITGAITPADILESIFSRFCIGK